MALYKNTQVNRARHYWARIRAATGRQRQREAADYIKAMLAREPDKVVDAAVEQVEQLVSNTETNGDRR